MNGRNRWQRWIGWITIVVAILSSTALPELVYGRAGGGRSYSGGRSSSSGGSRSSGSSRSWSSGSSRSSGGGGGSCSCLGDLLILCWRHPYVGVPVVCILVGLVVFGSIKGKNAHQATVIRRANRLGDADQRESIVARLQATDPEFDFDKLAARVGEAFVKIQHGWSIQNLSGVRPFISDAVHERFSLQFNEQKAMGMANRMENVNVHHVQLADLQSDERFDALSLAIDASATDQDVSLADGKVLRSSPGGEPFTEIWTFLRRRGAKTLVDRPGLIEGNCPNCGGAVLLNQSAQCQFCKAQLRSGQYDWVLTEITQECEWKASGYREPAGVAALREKDPEFNVQALEDRASVVFWRWTEANRLNSADPLRKVALPGCCDAFDAAARAKTGQRGYYGQCAVGSVETRGVLPSQDPNEYDRVLVDVKWSGTWMIVQEDGRLVRGEQSAVNRMLISLVRKPGLRTNADLSISSAHCPGCGAPEEHGASSACDFCGAALGDGSTAWVLDEILPRTSPRAGELLARLSTADAASIAIPSTTIDAASPAAPVEALEWMIRMAFADGQIEARERRMLQRVASQYKVPADRLEQMIQAAAGIALEIPLPADRDQAMETLKTMARTALVDGKLDNQELGLLMQAGAGAGLSQHDVQQLLKRTRNEVYTQAKAALRERNRGGRGA